MVRPLVVTPCELLPLVCRYLPPIPNYTDTAPGWLKIRDIVVQLPLVIFCQFHIVNITVSSGFSLPTLSLFCPFSAVSQVILAGFYNVLLKHFSENGRLSF